MNLKNEKIGLLTTLFMLSAAATFAAIVTDDNGIKYNTIDETSVSVGDNKEFSGSVVNIPASITVAGKTYTVANVGTEAFRENKNITTLTIAAKSVGEGAFQWCSNLNSITLQEGVESIYKNAFSYTAIKNLYLPASCTQIHSSTWYVPTFQCEKLENYTVAEGNPSYCSVDGMLFSKDKKTLYCCPPTKTLATLPEGVTTLGPNACWKVTFTCDTIRLTPDITYDQHSFDQATFKHLIIEGFSFNGKISAGKFSFLNAIIKTLTLCKNINYIYQLEFFNAQVSDYITILSETMPDWQYGTDTSWPCFASKNGMFNTPLYVPCGMAATYAADENKWANFTNISEIFPHKFSATSADEEKGTVTIVTAPDCDVDAQIKAEAKDDFVFKQWSDGNTETTRTLTIDQDTILVAEFVAKEVSAIENNKLTAIYAENGRIFGTENARIYDILGKDVTKDNGSLKGVFVVKGNSFVEKIVVR